MSLFFYCQTSILISRSVFGQKMITNPYKETIKQDFHDAVWSDYLILSIKNNVFVKFKFIKKQ